MAKWTTEKNCHGFLHRIKKHNFLVEFSKLTQLDHWSVIYWNTAFVQFASKSQISIEFDVLLLRDGKMDHREKLTRLSSLPKET